MVLSNDLAHFPIDGISSGHQTVGVQNIFNESNKRNMLKQECISIHNGLKHLMKKYRSCFTIIGEKKLMCRNNDIMYICIPSVIS